VKPQSTADTGGAAESHPTGKAQRRPPSPSEQARRKEWGRKWGPKVGRIVRQAIARTER